MGEIKPQMKNIITNYELHFNKLQPTTKTSYDTYTKEHKSRILNTM